MNQFINKILKEAEDMNDDSFFQPKTKIRDEEEIKKNEEIKKWKEETLWKIKSGLQKIRTTYENKDWESKYEELFLSLIYTLHLNEIYDKKHHGYYLLDKNDRNRCLFDLRSDVFWISYRYIWLTFAKNFHWNFNEIQSFIKSMLIKYFKINELTPFLEHHGNLVIE